MTKAPAFQFYASDFLTGTTLMSNAEVGLYIRLLCLQAENGSIPDDVERIVRAYGEEARHLWGGVRPKFNPGSTEGTLVNERLSVVLQARDEFRKRQSEKGKASAASRSSGSTTKQPQTNHGSTTVEPLEDGDRDISKKKERVREVELTWPVWAGPRVKAAWEEFKGYRWTTHKVKYKSETTEQHAVNLLGKYYATGQACVDGLNLAMAKGWKFPVDPDELTPKLSNGRPSGPMSKADADRALDDLRAKHGIAPGGFIETHLIPKDVLEAIRRP
jgi:uncharacterized protein YdaU (DUF1376 family)